MVASPSSTSDTSFPVFLNAEADLSRLSNMLDQLNSNLDARKSHRPTYGAVKGVPTHVPTSTEQVTLPRDQQNEALVKTPSATETLETRIATVSTESSSSAPLNPGPRSKISGRDKQHEVVYQIKYPKSNTIAVQIRENGSATIRWPNGSLAITVDLDTSSPNARGNTLD